MKKQIRRIISTMLCIVMIFSILPIMSYAQESKKEVIEITEKRDQNSKTYLNEDGTYTTIMTAEALHYQDGNGVWQEIDNRLESVGGVLQNKANGFTAKLPETMSEGGEVEISKEGTSLKLRAIGVSRNSLGNVKNNKEVSAKKQKIDYTNTWKLSSEAYYPEVYEGADVQYIVQATGIKENIIIKSAPEKKLKYKYEIIAEGVEGEKKEDGSIEFYKDGELEYVIPAPYMYDSSGSPEGYSVDIEVEFKATGKGKYMLTYTPSKEWLADSARVYPVTLDPTMTTAQNTTIVDDAYVRQETPTANYGMNSMLYANTNVFQGETYTHETYIKFNVDMEVPGVIMHAKMHLHFDGSATNYNAYMVTGSWTENGINWNNKPGYNSSIVCESDDPVDNGYTAFDITDIAIQWSHYGVANNGIRVKGAGGLTTHPTNSKFRSSEYGATNYFTTPFIEIMYVQTGSVITLNVTRAEQETRNWCWAACIQMLAEYEGVQLCGDNRAKQEYIYGKAYPNTSINDEKEAAYYEMGNILRAMDGVKFSGATCENLGINNVYKIYQELAEGNPVILMVQKQNEDVGHYLVVYKADIVNKRLYFIDPWMNGSGYSSATETTLFSGFTTPGIATSCTGIRIITY